MNEDDAPLWSHKDHIRELELLRKDASERCALLCEMMAGVYESQAATLRKDGASVTREYWPFGKRITVIDPEFERAATIRDNTARTFRTVAACCRAGWDPRALKTDPDERIGNYIAPGLSTTCDPKAIGEWARFQDTV